MKLKQGDKMISTKILGRIYTVDNDFNLITPDKTISKTDMQEIAQHYRYANRIHKPMALLFWTDVKNGYKHNWNLIEKL